MEKTGETGKTQIYLAIAFVLFLILVIISGRILDDLNKTKCTADAYLDNSKKWSKYFLAVSTIGMILALIGFIAFFFMKKKEE